MCDSSLKPWPSNQNAPKITHSLYVLEKANLAGILIGATFYGIVVILFFRCMRALFSPSNHKRRGLKCALAVHTMIIFSLATITTAANFDMQSISYINNRGFPGLKGSLPPGPAGYQYFLYPKAIGVVPDIAFLLTTWLADGLLLYRCYVIYAKNHWAVGFPCMMYLSCLVIGTTLIYYQTSKVDSDIWNSLAIDLGAPYYSISLSLNVLLTLMIVMRLILHSKNIRNATGTTGQNTFFYKGIITILIESSALYATTFLLFIGPWAAKSWVTAIFFPILTQTQVIAPFLIILRVANRSALTSNVIVSGRSDSPGFKSEGLFTNSNVTRRDGSSIIPTGTNGEIPSWPSDGVGTTVNASQDEAPLVVETDNSGKDLGTLAL